MVQETRRAVCEMCHARCRVAVYSQSGHLVKIEEDRSDPRVDSIFPPTRACIRLRGAKEWMYHPDRVNFPLRRAGARGEGKWERIPWDQALDEIANRLGEIRHQNGAEALAVTAGTARNREEYESRFLNLFGTPNFLGSNKICFAPQVQACILMFGRAQRHRMTLTLDLGPSGEPLTKSLLMVGMDPSQCHLRFWKSVNDCKKMGVKIIVIDPRRTQTAELADIWLQPRPGTDTALLMSMINVVIEEGLYDKEFVEKWCYGFDKLSERARDYSPDKVAEITWVPAEKVREAARMFGGNRAAISFQGMGLEHLQNSMQAIQARLALTAIIGDIDVEGGHYIPEPPDCIAEPEVELSEFLSNEQRGKQLGANRFKVIAWPAWELISEYSKRVWEKIPCTTTTMATAHNPTAYRAMLTGKPYLVKAVITSHSNPMVTQANTKLVYQALKSLDL